MESKSYLILHSLGCTHGQGCTQTIQASIAQRRSLKNSTYVGKNLHEEMRFRFVNCRHIPQKIPKWQHTWTNRSNESEKKSLSTALLTNA